MKSVGWVCVLCLSLLITDLMCEVIDEEDDEDDDERRDVADVMDAGDNEAVRSDAALREARSVDGGVKELRRGGSGRRGGGGGGGSEKRGKKKSSKKSSKKSRGRSRG